MEGYCFASIQLKLYLRVQNICTFPIVRNGRLLFSGLLEISYSLGFEQCFWKVNDFPNWPRILHVYSWTPKRPCYLKIVRNSWEFWLHFESIEVFGNSKTFKFAVKSYWYSYGIYFRNWDQIWSQIWTHSFPVTSSKIFVLENDLLWR